MKLGLVVALGILVAGTGSAQEVDGWKKEQEQLAQICAEIKTNPDYRDRVRRKRTDEFIERCDAAAAEFRSGERPKDWWNDRRRESPISFDGYLKETNCGRELTGRLIAENIIDCILPEKLPPSAEEIEALRAKWNEPTPFSDEWREPRIGEIDPVAYSAGDVCYEFYGLTIDLERAERKYGIDAATAREVRARCMRAMLRWPVFWWKHKYRYDKDAFAGCYEKSLIEQIRCFVPNVPPTWQEQVVETATSPRVQFVAATVGTAGIAALVLTGPVLAWRRRRRAAMGEQGFYYQDGHGQHGQGMTINVRAPVTVSEWMRRVYWTLALLMLLIPAGFILARTGTLVSLAAALVPVEWQDEVIKGLEALQELVRKASPQ